MKVYLIAIMIVWTLNESFSQVAVQKRPHRVHMENNIVSRIWIGNKDSKYLKVDSSRKEEIDYTAVLLNSRKDRNFYVLDSLYLEKVIFSQPIKSKHSHLYKNSMHFINNIFLDSLNFSECIFYKNLIFYESEFSSVNFSRCDFKKNVDFQDTFFKDGLSIDSLKNIQNREKSKFYLNSDDATANFLNTIFRGQVSFEGAEFGNEVNMANSRFYHLPRFNFCTLPKFMDFRYVKFYLNDMADVNSKIDFRTSYLGIRMKRRPSEIDSNRTQQSKCFIALSGTDVNKFLLPFHLFSLYFPKETEYEQKASIYESLISSCKLAGLTESAQSWDIEYRELQNQHDWPFIGRYVNLFNKHWWNFGYEKWRILLVWLPLFFLFFFVLNVLIIKWLYKFVYQDKEIGSAFTKDQAVGPMLNRTSYRISYTLFYTAVIYFGLKLRHEAVNYKNLGGLLYLYLMYLVGAIHVAFALSYILSAY